MKILILGSSGILGKRLFYKLSKYFNVYHTGLAKRKYNLKNTANIKKLLNKTKPNLIINCLAVADIDKCEKSKILSHKINVEMVKKFLNLKKIYDFHFIQFSTDQMYDGKNDSSFSSETSKPHLFNEYTKQKIDAEKICSKYKSLIFRINFFGKSFSKKKTITDWIFNAFKEKKHFFLIKDVIFNPLSIYSIENILVKLIQKKNIFKHGIYNLGSKNSLSKADFAIKFAKKIKLKNNNFTKIRSEKLFKIKRPKIMSMNVNKFEKTFNIKLNSLDHEIKNEVKFYKK